MRDFVPMKELQTLLNQWNEKMNYNLDVYKEPGQEVCKLMAVFYGMAITDLKKVIWACASSATPAEEQELLPRAT